MKIIVAAPPITGETQPMLRITRALVARGHAVTFVGASRFQAAAQAAGARTVAWRGAADYDDRDLDEAFPERAGLPPGMPQLVFDFQHVFGDAVTDQWEVLQEVLAQEREQDGQAPALLTNSLVLGAWGFALGAPGHQPQRWVAVGANPLVLSTPENTMVGPMPPEPGQDQRAANEAFNAGVRQAFEPARARVEELLRAVGATGDVPALLDGLCTVPPAAASLSTRAMEFGRTDVPASLRFVGPVRDRAAEGSVDERVAGFLARGRPVVVVTQGTVTNTDLGQLVEPTLTGLADADVTVVAALGRPPADLGVELPDNAVAEEFIAFDALLPHAAALVTNGGFGGVQLALAHGVPLVVAGGTEDKPLVAARVAASGAGIDLRTGTPEAGQVLEAVTAVLGEASYCEAAQALVPVYAALDAIDEIEEMLA